VVHEKPDLAGSPDTVRRVVGPCLAKDPAARPSPAQLIGSCRADGAVKTLELTDGWPRRPWPPTSPALAADLAGKNQQIAAALAGPDAPPSRLIRARMAIAALNSGGTMAALAAGQGTLNDTARDEVLNAAIATLGHKASARR
jgi:hypothetical protein